MSGGYSVGFDLATYFLHDVPEELLPQMESRAASQLDESFDDRCEFGAWPSIPIRVVAGRDDRFFLDFEQRVARERLGLDPVIVPGGHLAALSHPHELAAVIAGLPRTAMS